MIYIYKRKYDTNWCPTVKKINKLFICFEDEEATEEKIELLSEAITKIKKLKKMCNAKTEEEIIESSDGFAEDEKTLQSLINQYYEEACEIIENNLGLDMISFQKDIL